MDVFSKSLSCTLALSPNCLRKHLLLCVHILQYIYMYRAPPPSLLTVCSSPDQILRNVTESLLISWSECLGWRAKPTMCPQRIWTKQLNGYKNTVCRYVSLKKNTHVVMEDVPFVSEVASSRPTASQTGRFRFDDVLTYETARKPRPHKTPRHVIGWSDRWGTGWGKTSPNGKQRLV